MTPPEVWRAFMAFAGEGRFRAFVRALNTAPASLLRLRYWQAELWARFTRADPRWPADFASVREVFRACEVHAAELLRDTVLAPAGQIQWRETQSPDLGFPDSPREFAELPYPGWGVDPTAYPPSYPTKLVGLWYCPVCRELRAAWEAERAARLAGTRRPSEPGHERRTKPPRSSR